MTSYSVRAGRTAFWHDRRLRAIIAQVLLVAAIVLVGWLLWSNVVENLTRQRIATGFGFLDRTAGFGIAQTLIPYSEQDTHGRALIVGLLNTLLVSAIGIVVATILGFIIGIGRISNNWLIARICAAYVETLRNVPLLLQLLFWYFSVIRILPGPRQSLDVADAVFLNNRGLYLPRVLYGPEAGFVFLALVVGVVGVFFWARAARQQRERTGTARSMLLPGLLLIIGLPLVVALIAGLPFGVSLPELRGLNFTGGVQVSPELLALALALSTYTAAFIAEIVRAGVLGVPRGQSEAALSLGLTRGQTLRLVVVPQALRIIVPPLTSQYLNLTKNSSLGVVVAYPDLVNVFAGTTLNQTGQAIEVILITMGIYLSLSLITSTAMNLYNRRIRITER
jgi:general L-amino acid transport system permease protein